VSDSCQKGEKPREVFILQEEYSNGALVRTDAEKYPDDIEGYPGPAWIRFIEHSAYAKLESEARLHDTIVTSLQRAQKAMVDQLEHKLKIAVEEEVQMSDEREKQIEAEAPRDYFDDWKRTYVELTEYTTNSEVKIADLEEKLKIAVECLQWFKSMDHHGIVAQEALDKICSEPSSKDHIQNIKNKQCGVK
jgi:hypothetical protein